MTMKMTYCRIACAISLLFVSFMAADATFINGYSALSSLEGVSIHINKSKDGKVIKDLRGYPNSQPMNILVDADTFLGSSSIGLSEEIFFLKPKDDSNISLKGEMMLTITCPADITYTCDVLDAATDPYTSLTAFLSAGGQFNMAIGGIASFSSSQSVSANGNITTYTNTYTIMDGNGDSASCTQTIVEDTSSIDIEAPGFALDESIQINCDQDPYDFNLVTPPTSVSDNCDPSPTITYSEQITVNNVVVSLIPNPGIDYNIRRRWIVTDASGRESFKDQDISVRDTTPPMAVCQNEVTLYLDSNGRIDVLDNMVDQIFDNGSSDDCTPLDELNFSINRSLFFCDETNPVSLTMSVTDLSDNTGTCVVQATVLDTIAPIVTCPNDTLLMCSISELPPYSSFNAFDNDPNTSYSDNCGSNNLNFSSSTRLLSTGLNREDFIRTYYFGSRGVIQDSCSHIITVMDTISPNITSCPSPFSISKNLPNCTAAVEITPLSASDNCKQTINVTYQITYPTSSTLAPLNGTGDDASGDFPGGVSTIDWIVTDASGNIDSCSTTVTVTEISRPTVTQPDTLLTSCSIDDVIPYASVDDYNNNSGGTISDNCPLLEVTLMSTDNPMQASSCPDTITRTYVVTDESMNTSAVNQIIIINDTIDPTFTVPTDRTISCEQDINDLTVSGDVTDEADNCTVNEATYTDAIENQDCSLTDNNIVQIVTRTWTLVDGCMNSISQNQTITVTDNVAPVFNTFPSDITIDTDADVCDANATIATPAATDACGMSNIVNDFNGLLDASGTYPLGTTTVTWTATDECGNTTTRSINVTVEDNQDPVINNCPLEITTDCDISQVPPYANLSLFLAAGGSINEICPNPSLSTVSTTLVSTIDCVRTYHRIYQVTDGSGNLSNTCTQIITLRDEEAPVLMGCPAQNLTLNSASNQCSRELSITAPTATDNCGTVEVTHDMTGLLSNGVWTFPVGTTTVTYTATDLCGNTSTCSTTVTIEDNEAPDINCPATIMAQCSTGTFGIPAAYSDLSAFEAGGGSVSDACGINRAAGSFILVSENTIPNSCNQVVLRTYQISDVNGNTSQCVQRIEVNDNTPPVLTCGGNIELNTDANACTAQVDIIPTATDNCGGTVMITNNMQSIISNEAGVFPLGSSTVTWTAEDECGNTSICNVTVTVVDNQSPTITSCPTNITTDCDISQVPAYTNIAQFTSPSAGGIVTDNCTSMGALALNLISETSPPAGQCQNGDIIRVYQVTDESGNTATCSQTITILDEEAPVLTGCPVANLTLSSDINQCSRALSITAPTATDNCGTVEVTHDMNGLLSNGVWTFPVGTTTVTYTATDVCGNTSTCSTTVTIEDNQAPTINCPATIMAQCISGTSGVPAAYADIAAFEAGGGSVSDACGINRAAGGFILVSENTIPNSCNQVVLRTYQISDVNGNTSQCVQRIEVNDDEAPVLTCGGNIGVNTDPNVCTATINISDPTVTDNCTGAVTLTHDMTGILNNGMGTFPIGATTITWTATDECGNTSSCSIVVTVTDNQNPTITCPSELRTDCNISQLPPYATIAEFTAPGTGGTASDICTATDDLTIALESETAPPAGLCQNGNITRIYRVTDSSGLSATCSQIITVQDDEAPVLSACPLDITVNANSISCDAQVMLPDPMATDNCGIQSIVHDMGGVLIGGQGTFSVGETVVTWTATDNCGMTSTCSVRVTVRDIEDPVISCPSTLMVSCVELVPTEHMTLASFIADVDGGRGTVSDNCMIDNASFMWIEDSTIPNSCNQVLFRTYQISDISGNTSQCVQRIEVNDDEAPVFVCPSDFTVDANVNECIATVTIPDPSVTDNCNGTVTLTHDMTGLLNNGMFTLPIGATTITWTATDACGNISTCSVVVTVTDNSVPQITCPPDLATDCNISELPPYANIAEFTALGTASDMCTATDDLILSLVSETSPPAGLCQNGNITRIYRVTDSSGLSATCNQIITVQDDEAPVLTDCPADITMNADAISCDAQIMLPDPTATDNCGIQSLVHDMGGILIGGQGTFPVGETVVTWTATDNCNNTSTCSVRVTVVDNEAPDINCPATIMSQCSTGTFGIPAAYSDLAAFEAGGGSVSDACGIDRSAGSFMLVSENIIPNSCNQVVLRTYQISDVNGNTSQCVQRIEVNDDMPPIFMNCGGNIGVNTDSGLCTAMVSIANPPVMDNCGDDNVTLTHNMQGILMNGEGMFPIGTTTITWTATDECGNTSTCSFDIIVTDNQGLSIECPPTISAQCMIDEVPPYSDLSSFIAAGGMARGNCMDDPVFNYNGQTVQTNGCRQTFTRTYQVSDGISTATCTQIVIVEDTEAPTIDCTQDITVNANAGMCTGMIDLSNPTATDNCGAVTITHDMTGILNNEVGVFPVGTTVVTYTATDECGNISTCSVNVTVNDVEDPVITCPSGTMVECREDIPSAITDISVFSPSDNCGINTSSLTLVSEVSNTTSCPMTVTRTYQISDIHGNTRQCQQQFIVDDNIAPTIGCPSNIERNVDTGSCFATVSVAMPNTFDNCGIKSIVNNFTNTADASGQYPVGTTTVVYTVTDNCDNTSTCSFEVVVRDTTAPVITCPTDLTTNCNISQLPPYANIAAFTAPGTGGEANDNCTVAGNLILTLDSETAAPGVTCQNGNITRVYRVTDSSGNFATCSQTIMILDDEDPVLVGCPSDRTEDADAGMCSAMLNVTNPTATDNCGAVTITHDMTGILSNGVGVFPVGTTVVTYTATDACGNTSTCSVNITVNDAQGPVITCPPALSAQCLTGASGVPSIYTDLAAFEAAGGSVSDDCGIDRSIGSFMWIGDSTVPDNCNRVILRTYQISDLSGNTSQCTQQIMVNDDTAPTITCPSVAPTDVTAGTCSATVMIPVPSIVNDNCGIASTINDFNNTNDASGVYPAGTTTVTYTVTDNCGNTSTCSFDVLVRDNDNPTIACPTSPLALSLDCTTDAVTAINTYLQNQGALILANAGTSDICDNNLTITNDYDGVTLPANTCNGSRDININFTVADDSGNTASCGVILSVTISDDVSPTFDPPPAAIGDINCNDAFPTQEVLTASDNCSSVTVTPSVDAFTVDQCGGYQVTYRWRATDGCGNTSEVSRSFNVLPDMTGPVFDSAPSTMADVACDALPTPEVLTAMDACQISAATVTASVDPFTPRCEGYVVTHRWVASDNCNNTTVVTQSFNVLPDTQAPTFTTTPTAIGSVLCSAGLPDQQDLTATDNCNMVNIVESVDPFMPSNCANYNITYRWVATDLCGNSSSVTETFTVTPDNTPPVISTPADIDDIQCDEMMPTQETLTATASCGVATVVASVDPFIVNTCDGYMVTYRWVATDECTNTSEVTRSFNVLMDDTAPVLTCTDITVSTDSGSCQAAINVPAPTIVDNCSTVTITNNRTNTDNANDTYDIGDTQIVWTITDACDNTSTCTQTITVQDNVSPVIACVQNVSLTLDSNGAATINASDLVSSATDICSSSINIRARRLETNGGPCSDANNDVLGTSVSFCCADAANGANITVEVVVDDGNGSETTCTVMVLVTDAIAPSVDPLSVCLPDITISCEFPLDTSNLSVFGDIVFNASDVENIVVQDTFYSPTFVAGQDVLYTDNCNTNMSVTQTISGFDTLVCNKGTFSRTLLVTDFSGNTSSCVQTITIQDTTPFSVNDISWPADFVITDCSNINTDPSITGRPTFNIDNCSDPASTYSDVTTGTPQAGCQSIIRTWRVLDWCTYVPNSGSTAGIFEYVQNISVTNNVAPTFTFACQDTIVCANAMTCIGDINITATAQDDCTSETELFWSHTLDLFNLGTNVITKTGNVLSGTYPRGTHKVTWNVMDRCGNTSTCTYLITIRDCQTPQVICINGLSTTLLNMNGGGMIDVWAKDFVKQGLDNCTLEADIKYSFSSDTTNTSVIYTCDNLGSQTVQIWATDEDGNQSFCVTSIDVQDNENACSNVNMPGANVSGSLRTASEDGIMDVEVSIESSEMVEYMMSEYEGEYAFADIEMYQNYDVRPFKNDDVLNGVSTLDLLIIQKHILSITKIDNPYKLIAADINGSGSISAIDLIELRKLILGIYEELPNNTSWRFINQSFEFDDINDPWPFEEYISLMDLSHDAMESNFIGIKVGDVNNSVVANNITGDEGQIENRSSFEGIRIKTIDQKFESNEMLSVPLIVDGFKDITGLQMTVKYDHLQMEYAGFGKAELDLSTENLRNMESRPGVLTLSWDDVKGVNLGEGSSMINLMFKTKSEGSLVNALDINSSVIASEVYDSNLRVGDVIFEVEEKEIEKFKLYQNKPNPFAEVTEINFDLPRDMNTTLIIYDGIGNLIHTERGSYKAGSNTIVINKEELNVSSGILYYKLKAENFSGIMQMLLIE